MPRSFPLAVLSRAAAAVALATFFVSSAFAAQWTVLPEKSALIFEADQAGTPVPGEFATWSAEIDFDPAAPETAAISVTVDLASLETPHAQAAQMLPGEAWLDLAGHPVATFRTTSVRTVSEGAFEAEGVLELRGTELPLTLPFTLDITGDTAIASGEAVLDRVAFGIGADVPPATLAAPVRVRFELAATRQ